MNTWSGKLCAHIHGLFPIDKVLPFITLTRLSQLDPDLGNFADGLNGNWLIGLVRSRKNSGKAAAVPTK
jgi:hypothetical protein